MSTQQKLEESANELQLGRNWAKSLNPTSRKEERSSHGSIGHQKTSIGEEYTQGLRQSALNAYFHLRHWRCTVLFSGGERSKAALELKDLSLTQGNLFGILYPENSELLSQAGPDVQMLRKILKYLFNNLEGSPLPGRSRIFSPVVDVQLSGGNELDEEEEVGFDGDGDVMKGIEYEMIQMNSSEDELDNTGNEGQPPRKRARR